MPPKPIKADGNATHLEALVWTLAKVDGPVLELRVGWYSTPVLAGISKATGRSIVSVEDDPRYRQWARERWEGGRHRIVAPGPDGIHPAENLDWAVVLVDHGDGPRRVESVRRYQNSVLVVHDTDPEHAWLYPDLEEETPGVPAQHDGLVPREERPRRARPYDMDPERAAKDVARNDAMNSAQEVFSYAGACSWAVLDPRVGTPWRGGAG